jgi:hypothetical protein
MTTQQLDLLTPPLEQVEELAARSMAHTVGRLG